MKNWKRFNQVRPHDRIVIDGEEFSVHEVVMYHRIDSDEMWANLMTRIGNREVAVEAVRGEDDVTLWQRVPRFRKLVADPTAGLKYKREIYSLEEKGIAKATVENVEGVETAEVPYWVLRAKSGLRIAVEIWDGQPYCYIAEATPPQVSF